MISTKLITNYLFIIIIKVETSTYWLNIFFSLQFHNVIIFSLLELISNWIAIFRIFSTKINIDMDLKDILILDLRI